MIRRVVKVWVGVLLAGLCLSSTSHALPADFTSPFDYTDLTSRSVLVWFEQSPSMPPADTPDTLDADWSSAITAFWDGALGELTVDGSDFESILTNVGYNVVGGSFSDYVFQYNVITGDFVGTFTGQTTTADGDVLDWDGTVDSLITDGAWEWGMMMLGSVANALNGDFNYWEYCTGVACDNPASGVVGWVDLTFDALDMMGNPFRDTVTMFNPFGEIAFGEVPEPSTALLLVAGLLSIALVSRHRTR